MPTVPLHLRAASRLLTSVAALVVLCSGAAAAQQPASTADSLPAPAPSAARSRTVWRTPKFWLGAGASILAHELGHVVAAEALGGRVTFGFDRGRPTVYSGLDVSRDSRRQFVFSAAGLTVQAMIDELLLDLPHGDAPATAFTRGVLAGGVGTTLFYITLGRTGSVSDIDFMARTSSLSKGELSLIFGSVSALHAWRASRQERFAEFFVLPAPEGGVRVGATLR